MSRAGPRGPRRPDRGQLTQAVGAHGLATGFGDTGSVGIGGITLGGGVGYLVRKYGLTIDDLLAAEIVTADGELLRVDAEHIPTCSGRSAVAAATSASRHGSTTGSTTWPTSVGGMLILPATAETVAGFIAAAEAAPEELSTIANVMPCPPMPFVPAEHHGRLVIIGLMAFAGDSAAEERAVAPFRALATPIADMVKPSRTRDVPARGPRLPPDRRCHAPCSSTASMTTSPRRSSSSWRRRMRRCASRSCACSVVRWPASPPTRRRSRIASRIMVNVAAFYDGPDDKRAPRGMGRPRSPAALEPGATRRLRQLPR